jgi:hypothetical protein
MNEVKDGVADNIKKFMSLSLRSRGALLEIGSARLLGQM